MFKDISPGFVSVIILGLVITLASVPPEVEARAFFVLVIVGNWLGPTLPYLNPQLRGEKLLVGANFASAGMEFSMILESSSRASSTTGQSSFSPDDPRGNDFVNNYYLVPFSARSRQFALPDYVVYLISEYRKILMRVYELGARRVLVTGTGPLGCVPAERAMRSRNGECAAELQTAAGLFNPQLVQMLLELNRGIGSDVFIAANAYDLNMDFVTNPRAYGFVTSQVACCGQGRFNGIGYIFAFWDPFHPTERANRIIVSTIVTGSTKFMNPMNLSTIMALDSLV
ncbi:GDSL esterase/lipase LTL [Salix suchowensis]|nr:GDSL esterase/lipase LTL [Salix suchowensis]